MHKLLAIEANRKMGLISYLAAVFIFISAINDRSRKKWELRGGEGAVLFIKLGCHY